MATQGIVQIAAGPDGSSYAETLRERLAGQARVADGTAPAALPQPHENAVLVFILTPDALTDPGISAHAARAAGSRFPMLAVPPQRVGFDFRTLTDDFAYLGKLNAVGWDDGAEPGGAVLTAVRRHLGLEPFPRDCRLFVSYRRTDGREAALAIYAHLRARGFDAFLDTEDDAIEAGEEFQTRIHEAIGQKDLLLLIDSPDAADSAWVREEVSEALANRVSIFVVRVGGSDGFPQVRDLPALDWGPDPERCLIDLERAVRSRLAARRSFDRRLQQTLAALEKARPVCIDERGQRRLALSLGADSDGCRCLLDYEDAPFDLTRLHRLAKGFEAECRARPAPGSPLAGAVLVHRGRRLSPEEQDALDWARRGEPLHVLALDQVLAFFLSLRAPA